MNTKLTNSMTLAFLPLLAFALLPASVVFAKTEVKASSILPPSIEKNDEDRLQQEDSSSGNEVTQKSVNNDDHSPVLLEVTERHLNDLGGAIEELKTSGIPDWAKEENLRIPGDGGVFVSKRFATIAEAQKDLEGLVSEKFDWRKNPRRKLPSLDYSEMVSLGGIARECVIIWPLEVGGYVEPVYQVAVQVRSTEPVRKKVARAIKNRAGRKNLTFVLGGVGLATLFLGVSSLYIRKHARHSEFKSE